MHQPLLLCIVGTKVAVGGVQFSLSVPQLLHVPMPVITTTGIYLFAMNGRIALCAFVVFTAAGCWLHAMV